MLAGNNLSVQLDLHLSHRAPRTVAPESLESIWHTLQVRYFPLRADLLRYQLKWSQRHQRRCLASCNFEKRRIVVARALRPEKYRPLLEPLLYHEMCHAVLGRPKRVRGRFQIHGADFKALERRHPQITALDDWIKSGGWTSAVRSETRRINLARVATLIGL